MCYLARVWVDLASECSASPHERGLYAVGSQNYLLIKLYLGWTNFCLFSEWGGLALPCWDKSERHQSNLTELAVPHLWKQPATCCQVLEEKFRAVDGLSLLCDKLGDLSADFCFFLLSVNEYIVPCVIDLKVRWFFFLNFTIFICLHLLHSQVFNRNWIELVCAQWKSLFELPMEEKQD